MGKLIPARYIGEHELLLSKFGGPYLNGDGLPLQHLVIRFGQVLMMDEGEVNGFTVLNDLRHEKDPVSIGPGKQFPEGLSDAEAQAKGYQYHEGRRDFEAVTEKPAVISKKNEGAK